MNSENLFLNWTVREVIDNDYSGLPVVQIVHPDWHPTLGPALICTVGNPGERTAKIAKLLSAAPELLEALKECITDEGSIAERSHVMAMCRLQYITKIAKEAIAKATI